MMPSNQDTAIPQIDDERLSELVKIIQSVRKCSDWTNELFGLLGDTISGAHSQKFYFDIILHKERILEEMKNSYAHEVLFGDSFIQHIFRLHAHMLQRVLEGTCVQEPRDFDHLLGSTQHHDLIVSLLLGATDIFLSENPLILLEIIKLFPQNLIIIRNDRVKYLNEGISTDSFWEIYTVTLEKLADNANSIVSVMKRHDNTYSIYTLLSHISGILRNIPVNIRRNILCSALGTHRDDYRVSGFILSLESIDLLSCDAYGVGRQCHPLVYVQSFWASIGEKPNFNVLSHLVEYMSFSMILVSSHELLTHRMVGLSLVTPDELGALPSWFSNMHLNPNPYSTDPRSVKSCLKELREMNFPFGSDAAAKGVLASFNNIITLLNKAITIFLEKHNDPSNPSLAVSVITRLKQFPLRVSTADSAGSELDYSKSRALVLLAEYGLFIRKDTLNSFLDSTNDTGPVVMPYTDIANFVNWSHGEFLCIRFKKELSKYFDEKGGWTSYQSRNTDVQNFVDSLIVFLNKIPDTYCRTRSNKLTDDVPIYSRELPEVSGGDIDMLLGETPILLEQCIPAYNSLQSNHQKLLFGIAKDFIHSNFKEGTKVVCQFDTKGNNFTPMHIKVKTELNNTKRQDGRGLDRGGNAECNESSTLNHAFRRGGRRG